MDSRTEPGGRAPIICAEFVYEGQRWQTILRPGDDERPSEWDTVRGDDPYIWRRYQTFSREFDGE